MKHCWTLDKLMASLSTCHLKLMALGDDLGKSCLNIVQSIT